MKTHILHGKQGLSSEREKEEGKEREEKVLLSQAN